MCTGGVNLRSWLVFKSRSLRPVEWNRTTSLWRGGEGGGEREGGREREEEREREREKDVYEIYEIYEIPYSTNISWAKNFTDLLKF